MCEAHWRWHSHDTDGTLPSQAVASTKGQRIQASGASMSRHAGSAIRLQLPPARPQGHLYNISVAIGVVDWNGGCGDAEDVRAVDRRERMCTLRRPARHWQSRHSATLPAPACTSPARGRRCPILRSLLGRCVRCGSRRHRRRRCRCRRRRHCCRRCDPRRLGDGRQHRSHCFRQTAGQRRSAAAPQGPMTSAHLQTAGNWGQWNIKRRWG